MNYLILLVSINLWSFNALPSDVITSVEKKSLTEQTKPCIVTKIGQLNSQTNDDEPVGQIGEGCENSSEWCSYSETYDPIYAIWLPPVGTRGKPQITISACRIPCSVHTNGSCP